MTKGALLQVQPA